MLSDEAKHVDNASASHRSYFITPDRLLWGLLLLVGLLILSEWLHLFSFHERKGWALFLGLAAFAGTLAFLLFWFLKALFLRQRFQYGLRSLLALTIAVAVLCSWYTVKLRQAERQRKAVESIEAFGGGVSYSSPTAPVFFYECLNGEKMANDLCAEVSAVFCTNTKITDTDLECLAVLPSLNLLDLKITSISDEGLAHLTALKNLRILELALTQVTDAGLKHLEEFNQLECLDLKADSVTDRGLKNLDQLKQLRMLDLTLTKITDSGLETVGGMKELRVLYLHSTKITDAGLVHISKLTQLQTLGMARTGITDEGLRQIQDLKQLKELFIGNNKITDEGLMHLQQLTNLESLTLENTDATEEGIDRLRKALPNCRITNY